MKISSILSTDQSYGCRNLHTARAAFGLLLLFALSTFGVKPVSAQSYHDLYEFGASGCCPSPSLMAEGRDGNVYGTTSTGGTASKGTVFKMSLSGVLTTIYNFDGTHGTNPVGGLVLGTDGNFYGTAENGGANGYGNIFQITPAGVLTVIYDFKGTADGGYPISPLVIGSDGFFYGTSYPYYAYKVSAGGEFHSLTRVPGITAGPLLQAADGSFYGVTEFQGTNGGGTVYRVSGTTCTTLYNFVEATGAFPIGGLVEGADGNLYGTTTGGGPGGAGVIYRITPKGAYSVVVYFDNVHTLNGYEADAGLIAGADGLLYGATVWGGKYGYGVIFSMTTDGVYNVLYSFNAPSGAGAYATPMQHNSGKIYGTTTRGGGAGKGVLYSFSDGLDSFAELVLSRGPVGRSVGIIGRDLNTTSSVEFNGTPASFHVVSSTYLTATVPSGETGFVRVDTALGALVSEKVFRVTPQMTSFAPASGAVGSTVTLTGAGLIQAEIITVGGVRVTSYTVNSDSTVTFEVPTGAKTGTIVLTTPGGKTTSNGTFTVTP